MEHICRVKTAQTKSMNHEIYWPLYFGSKTRKIKLALFVLMLFAYGAYVTCITVLYWKFFSTVQRMLMISMWAMFLYCSYRTIFQANRYACAEEKHRQKIVGDKLVFTDMLFYDSHFCIHSALSSTKQTVSYSDVVWIKETEHYYVVVTTTNFAYAFDKNGFADGTCDQAIQLLREKGNLQGN